MSDKSIGLLRNPGKYSVRRTDGKDLPGRTHDGCEYFVLDLTHDKYAREALRAYVRSCAMDGYNDLAVDLYNLLTGLDSTLPL